MNATALRTPALVRALLLGLALAGAVTAVHSRKDTPEPAARALAPASAPDARPARLDINTASAKELEKLPKMTKSLARAVVENRPYRDIRELSDRGILQSGVYAAIRNRIEVTTP